MTVKNNTIHFDNLKIRVTYKLFGEKDRATEFHAIIELTDYDSPAAEQFEKLNDSVLQLFSCPFLVNISLVGKRYFVTDAANQSDFFQQTENEVVSVVQQPPLNGSKAMLWVYGVENTKMEQKADGAVIMKRPHYSHVFHTQLHEKKGDPFQQTTSVFEKYITSLGNLHATLEANCIRTWLFIQDVDNQYAEMVKARKMLFEAENMTSKTHYIASTGIEGRYIYPNVIVLMDAYAIPEIKREQVIYLNGASHLNPTHEYGVTFERGTIVQFGDRRHVFISGTASINNSGEVVHLLNIGMQIKRVLENISVLLQEANCEMDDIAHLIIYLRDIADYKTVESYMESQYPHIPKVIVLAPVCRPEWLIEMECMAIKFIKDSRFECY
jgi:enamine deaminase RidA (YjgF/YER057c/UK114 family)